MFNSRTIAVYQLHLKSIFVAMIVGFVMYFFNTFMQVMSAVVTSSKYYPYYATTSIQSLFIIPVIVAFLLAGNRTKHMKRFVAMGLTRKNFYKSALIFVAMFSALFMGLILVLSGIELAIYNAIGVGYLNPLFMIFEKVNILISIATVFEFMIITFLVIVALECAFLIATYFFDKSAWVVGLILWFGLPIGLSLLFTIIFLLGGIYENPILILFGNIFDFIFPVPYTSPVEHIIYISVISLTSALFAYFFSKLAKISRL